MALQKTLEGKVAVITGSSRGIGRAIAERYAKEGAKVVVSSRKLAACQPVAEAIRAAGGTALALECHVGKREQLEQLVAETTRTYGGIDVLVCNAATNPVFGPLQDVSDEAFDKILQVNLRSTFQLCKLVLPDMAKRGGGSVVLISSIAGLHGSLAIAAYGVSKAAELSLARSLAVEWGRQSIRVNSIAPGLVRTDFARALWENPDLLAQVEARTPLGRIGEPEDIAGIALFLASNDSRFITGQTLVADGGATIADPL
jgi:NAD(P)-dependent dehydrogenase (short-subunit alcohol dehydrogenase family)